MLGANSLEEGLHVVVIAERDGVLGSVVRMLIALLHLRELVAVVTLAVLSLVTGLLTKNVRSQVKEMSLIFDNLRLDDLVLERGSSGLVSLFKASLDRASSREGTNGAGRSPDHAGQERSLHHLGS